MQKINGHWVAKRVGIIEHYKDMTLSEIVLFDTYLLLANKQTWECWRTIGQLEDMLPMARRTIINAKNGLAEKGWIKKIGQSGVFIPKLCRHVDEQATGEPEKVQNGNQKVQNGNYLQLEVKEPNSAKCPLNSAEYDKPGAEWKPNSAKCPPIIEDGIIIEDDYLLVSCQV